MEPFPTKDIAIEVLSRLPAKSLMAFRCTAKRWNDLVSDPSFIRIYDERSKDILGLFAQQTIPDREIDLNSVNLLNLTQTGSMVENTVLDFLPEKVVLVSASNGILCCRSCVYSQHITDTCFYTLNKGLELKSSQKNFAIYICNPATKEWITIRSKGDINATLVLGLAFYPFSSSSGTRSRFKLVNLQRSRSDPNTYSFAIYSSETQKWETSKEVCKFSSYIYPSRVIFSNGRLHWLMSDHHIVTFHVEKEWSKVMKLPGVTPREIDKCRFGICLGESKGCLYYVCAFVTELLVWVLKDLDEPAWELKYRLDLAEITDDSSVFETYLDDPAWSLPSNYLNFVFDPLAFYDDVLYARIYGMPKSMVISYDFKTGTLINRCKVVQLGKYFNRHPIVLPYRVSLLPLPSGYLRVRHCRRNKKRRLYF